MIPCPPHLFIHIYIIFYFFIFLQLFLRQPFPCTVSLLVPLRLQPIRSEASDLFSAAPGLLLTSGGEVCRHAEGQGAAAPAAAARAADTAAQQRLHLGEPGRPGDAHATVPGRKSCVLLLSAAVPAERVSRHRRFLDLAECKCSGTGDQ